MSFDACAALVQEADPNRFRTALLAAPEQRPGLMALYAFNIEVSRAPWVTQETMIAEMRLQWWLDAIAEIFEGNPPRKHEVVGPLAETITQYSLPREPLDALINARRGDIYKTPPADLDALKTYIDATSSGLMWLAALVCSNGEGTAEKPVRQVGFAHGVAGLLRATPDLLTSGRQPFPKMEAENLSEIAQDALSVLASARTQRRQIPKSAAPALLMAWQSETVLAKVLHDPDATLRGVDISQFRQRWTLMLRALTGRW